MIRHDKITSERTAWYYTHMGYEICAVCADPDPQTAEGRNGSTGSPTYVEPSDEHCCDLCGATRSVLEFEAKTSLEFFRGCNIF